ncbi:MAG: 30S ribosomal protein S18 [Spartobacteria bacterium]|nr:30S ribosomal protein S18 [Spartobacteria bacterium]
MKPRKPAAWVGRTITRKGCKYLEGIESIDYKDHELLRKFMTERGKIMPRRLTGASALQQRQLKQAIRRARVMGLLR